MLNRIYIIIGTLAIIALAGAFIAPRFIQWSNYRDRMEVLASEVLGTEVAIRGDIEFSLLPAPRLHFTDVVVGDVENPAATVASVDAEFSLVDFLRDNYRVTKLVLGQPVVDVIVDESGLFGSGFNIAESPEGTSRMAVGQANIVDGTMRLTDLRSEEKFTATGIDGELKLAAITGPFQFSGNLDYDAARYSLRFNTSAMDGDGSNRITAFVGSESGISLQADGQLTPGMAPRFDGTITYRQKPLVTDVADDIRGDLVLESKVTGSTDRIVLTGYTLQPDENRAGTRLTGAASIQLGDKRSFDAVISGGVFALPPRDASEDLSQQPYDVVRLLGELPAPPIPPMPGRIGVDLAEVGLRSFALRGLRIDAHTDGKSWAIDQFIAKLPGDTDVRASGALGNGDGKPTFEGKVTLTTERLDALGALWRKPAESNPLFNMHASYSGNLLLAGDALGFNDGVFTLDGVAHSLGLRVGFGAEQRLDVTGKFDDLSPQDSTALVALLPDVQASPAFGLSFPSGSFGLSAVGAQVLGLRGESLIAEGNWVSDRINFTRLAAGSLGGVALNTALVVTGTLAEPMIWGSGTIDVAQASAKGLEAAFDALGITPGARELLKLSAPANVGFTLDPPVGTAQQLALKGTLDTATLDLTAQLSDGIAQALVSPVTLMATLESASPDALTRQIGFGDAQLFPPNGDMFVAINLDGAAANSFAARLNASVGEERLGFAGNVLLAADGEVQGTGTLDGYLSQASGLARIVGARGLSLPMASGSAELHFEGDRLLRLTAINGKSGEAGFSGELSLSRTGATAVAAGSLALDTVDFAGLTAALTGPAALIPGDGSVWPTGPIDTGDQPRQTRGTINISTPSITLAGESRMRDASFDLSWDDSKLRVAHFAAFVGTGTVAADVTVCCSDALSNKTIAGRITVAGIALADALPPDLAETLGGTVDGGVQFSGTGESLADIMGAMTGQGSFSAKSLSIAHLDPKVFPTVAGLDNLLETDGDALAALIGIALERGAFTAPVADGAFTIAGGVARLANLSIDGAGGRLAGDANIALKTLGLSGSFALTPLDFDYPNKLVNPDTAQIVSRLSGTILAPERTLDLDTMVAAVQMRANEIEVDRLEALRAEDAARQKAAAEERNRLIAEQRARQEAEATAAAAAAEEKQRVEDEAARQQTLTAPQTAPAPVNEPVPTGPIDLGLQPNQPTTGTTTTNQPFFTPLN